MCNIKFERKANFSTEKSPPPPMSFEGAIAFNLRKQNVTYFPFISLTQNFVVLLKNLKETQTLKTY